MLWQVTCLPLFSCLACLFVVFCFRRVVHPKRRRKREESRSMLAKRARERERGHRERILTAKLLSSLNIFLLILERKREEMRSSRRRCLDSGQRVRHPGTLRRYRRNWRSGKQYLAIAAELKLVIQWLCCIFEERKKIGKREGEKERGRKKERGVNVLDRLDSLSLFSLELLSCGFVSLSSQLIIILLPAHHLSFFLSYLLAIHFGQHHHLSIIMTVSLLCLLTYSRMLHDRVVPVVSPLFSALSLSLFF